MSTYDSLTAWLADHDGAAFSIAFAALEGVLDSALPPAARDQREWWSNSPDAGPQSAAWSAAGWKVVSVDLAAQKVRFERRGAAARAA
ncbi:MAG: hypothetical protein KJZ65_03030 [Phycisphaerales bacterium]|nr:hypothetical protein [Phycisphaerales bacterium]